MNKELRLRNFGGFKKWLNSVDYEFEEAMKNDMGAMNYVHKFRKTSNLLVYWSLFGIVCLSIIALGFSFLQISPRPFGIAFAAFLFWGVLLLQYIPYYDKGTLRFLKRRFMIRRPIAHWGAIVQALDTARFIGILKKRGIYTRERILMLASWFGEKSMLEKFPGLWFRENSLSSKILLGASCSLTSAAFIPLLSPTAPSSLFPTMLALISVLTILGVLWVFLMSGYSRRLAGIAKILRRIALEAPNR